MEPRIRTLAIEQFRCLRDFKVEGLGRVSMLTGRNNTGKSSVLEAILLLAGEGHPYVLNEIMRFREEVQDEDAESAKALHDSDFFPWSSLFTDFPDFSPSIPPIYVHAHGRDQNMKIGIAAGWYTRVSEPGGGFRIVPMQENLFDESAQLPGLVVRIGNSERFLSYDNFLRFPRRYVSRSRITQRVASEEFRLKCISVGPFGGQDTATLDALWDSIALSNMEEAVVEALKIIDDSITGLSMIGGEGRSGSRTAIVRARNQPRPVPLRTYGDGLSRVFGIALSLVNAAGGLLLIDEFENGMHHSVQTDVWRAVFRLARELDVQVVATSHSWDAIEAFQEAARETPEEGVLIRLTRRGNAILPTLFREEELSIATREGIEVR